MPEPTSDLRERVEASFGPAMRLGLQDAELFDGPGAERIEEWITHITDQVLTALASDPGNLPARMAEVIASHEWTDFPRSAHNQHNYYAECAVCQRDILRMAEVALGVRDELVAHLSARTAEAGARVGHAEAGAELSSERLAKVRQELAEAKREHQAKVASLQAFADRCRERDWAHSAEQAKRREEAERKLHEIAMVKVWTNEDGKRFVFADDLAGIVLDMPVEGTTTPARETA